MYNSRKIKKKKEFERSSMIRSQFFTLSSKRITYTSLYQNARNTQCYSAVQLKSLKKFEFFYSVRVFSRDKISKQKTNRALNTTNFMDYHKDDESIKTFPFKICHSGWNLLGSQLVEILQTWIWKIVRLSRSNQIKSRSVLALVQTHFL